MMCTSPPPVPTTSGNATGPLARVYSQPVGRSSKGAVAWPESEQTGPIVAAAGPAEKHNTALARAAPSASAFIVDGFDFIGALPFANTPNGVNLNKRRAKFVPSTLQIIPINVLSRGHNVERIQTVRMSNGARAFARLGLPPLH